MAAESRAESTLSWFCCSSPAGAVIDYPPKQSAEDCRAAPPRKSGTVLTATQNQAGHAPGGYTQRGALDDLDGDSSRYTWRRSKRAERGDVRQSYPRSVDTQQPEKYAQSIHRARDGTYPQNARPDTSVGSSRNARLPGGHRARAVGMRPGLRPRPSPIAGVCARRRWGPAAMLAPERSSQTRRQAAAESSYGGPVLPRKTIERTYFTFTGRLNITTRSLAATRWAPGARRRTGSGPPSVQPLCACPICTCGTVH